MPSDLYILRAPDIFDKPIMVAPLVTSEGHCFRFVHMLMVEGRAALTNQNAQLCSASSHCRKGLSSAFSCLLSAHTVPS